MESVADIMLNFKNPGLKRYLFWFANEHADFRLPEIKSIVSLYNISMKWVEAPSEHPFWIVELPSDDSARKIASRSVCLRRVIELWGRAKQIPALHQQLRALPPEFVKPFCAYNKSFKIKVETFCNSQSQREKLEKIETFSYLPFEGPVKLKNPDVVFQYIEYYGMDPNKRPSIPHDVFFGLVICKGQRELIARINLKERKFIGNTSMDPQLSLLMANQAKVKAGDLVLDPFVGTGSLLIAAACFGGYVLGTDIDYLMLHARTKPTRKQDRFKGRNVDESVQANFLQYQMQSQYVDVVVADSSLPLWRQEFVFDSIIADPPYGIRESMERVGSYKQVSPLSEEYIPTHIPSKVEYNMEQMLKDLLCFSARHLKLGGRLVTWIPVFRSEYDEKNLPCHPCLSVVANSEQLFSTCTSRRLLTYQKHKEPLEDSEDAKVGLNLKTFRQKYFSHMEAVRAERKRERAKQEAIRESQSR